MSGIITNFDAGHQCEKCGGDGCAACTWNGWLERGEAVAKVDEIDTDLKSTFLEDVEL